MSDPLLVNCPHCQQLIHVEQINCAIFRCGVEKQTGQQIPPHLPKPECDRLASENRIYGRKRMVWKPLYVITFELRLCGL
jgi:hypothetical protein